MNTDLMPQNLLDTQAGKALCKAGVSLQRDEDDILPYEDVEWQDGDLSAEERIFLEEFPILKGELEVGIRKLHTLADQVDTTHRTLTKTSIVANSITVVSEVMSILGLVLAPAVAGGSLVLSAAGRVLGKAGEITSILTNVLERFHSQEAQAYVGSLVPTRAQEVRGAGAAYVLAAGKVVQDCESTVKDIRKSIRAFQIARANPRLAAAAKNLLTTGQVSARRSRQVQRAFEGTTLVMKTKARLLGTAMAGFSLSVVLASLLKDWKQLKEGTKSELAEELRAQAWELERKLTEFTQCYESLQQKRKGPVRTKQEGSCLQARESPHRELDRPAPGSEARSLQNYEKIHFCCFIPQTVVFISELMQLAKCLQLCGGRVRMTAREPDL
ncbi:apolipoprotein L6 isoform X1 [Orcinus orca]|uniref:apolipoprotein L6 isoform X1 n=1 Tax=Orcinus orca TaxID=9733 RepID=UPI0014419CF3|nr:apolipoprotein L6 isoform X1 [Orcinus orca]XP_033273206.1 apolipoprotein L6 isoform X1 [Orcinus orca]